MPPRASTRRGVSPPASLKMDPLKPAPLRSTERRLAPTIDAIQLDHHFEARRTGGSASTSKKAAKPKRSVV